jgi:dihydrodipicolinate synthase/N-acetylneuraminate lyase
MNIEQVLSRIRPRRKVKGIAAALLPLERSGAIAVEAFQKHLLRTHSAGLRNAVNMDTGYVNYLSEEEQRLVLKWTRAALPANALSGCSWRN